MKKAVYAGSFDPVTFGHECIINAAAKMFDLTVAIATNPHKKHLFDLDTRTDLVRRAIPSKVKTATLKSGLLTEFCRENGISVIVRGLRSVNDLEYELQIANTNRDLFEHAQTIFIPAPAPLNYISSTQVKEVASLGGNISKYANSHVKNALTKKFTPRKGTGNYTI